MNELQKKQSLYEKLNMDLDEANELFAEETLQSMQMAKIVGGNASTFPTWEGIIKFIKGFNTVAEAWDNIKKLFQNAPTEAPGKPADTNGTTFDLKNMQLSNINGETIVITADSITVHGAYDVKVLIGPTPSPQ